MIFQKTGVYVAKNVDILPKKESLSEDRQKRRGKIGKNRAKRQKRSGKTLRKFDNFLTNKCGFVNIK